MCPAPLPACLPLSLSIPIFELFQAEIEGPTGTPFEGKFFQLKLVLSADFPASPPRGFFLTKIYHPNVEASSGAICVNTLKKDWTATTTFSHVLSVIRCLLIVPFPESSLNDEAGKLFMESYDEYHRRARLMADVHGRPTPFDYESADDEDEESDDAMVGNIADVKPSASQSAVGSNDAKKAGALDDADSPVKRSLKRGVSTGATNSSSSSSRDVGGSSAGGSQSNNTMRSLSSTSGINVLSRSNTGGLSSSGNSMKKIGADGKKKAVKKKKNNGLGRL